MASKVMATASDSQGGQSSWGVLVSVSAVASGRFPSSSEVRLHCNLFFLLCHQLADSKIIPFGIALEISLLLARQDAASIQGKLNLSLK